MWNMAIRRRWKEEFDLDLMVSLNYSAVSTLSPI